MSCEDGHTVSILGSNGKMVEWNGDDYVEQGSSSPKSTMLIFLSDNLFNYSVSVQAETTCSKDKDNGEKDSDQYLVRGFILISTDMSILVNNIIGNNILALF